LTSFERVPGDVTGHGLPDILEDIQEVANATLRSLVNNMAIASGPQVVVNTERLAPTENADELYPWKRWRVVDDPMASQQQPITFFQPQNNSQELLSVYSAMSGLADDISTIPRYVTSGEAGSGAGRTASGLSMLMGNSQKILQTVAANVDMDVMEGVLTALYDMIMLTDTSGMLTGEEQIAVNGVDVAIQKETERQKQLQFLQITANPMDSEIVGPLGRARVLRAVSSNMGLPDDVVPDDNTMQQQLNAAQQAAKAKAAMGGSPDPEAELNKAKIENLRATGLAAMVKAGVPIPGVPTGGLTSLDQLPSQGQGQSPSSAAARAQGNQAPQPTPTQLSDQAPPFNNFQPQQGVPTNG
jgi:hypothetical protein